ncbi:MAG TPA: protease Do, partial [Oceanicaulis sp.]|nr:protease Do [Oceanicaulis sp.]
MKLTKRLILSATVAALSLGAATTAVVSAQEAPSAYTYGAPNGAPMSFASLIERVSPAVVSIEAEGSVDAGDAPDMSQLPPQFREFFERFGGMPDQPRERRAQGSGFFIS